MHLMLHDICCDAQFWPALGHAAATAKLERDSDADAQLREGFTGLVFANVLACSRAASRLRNVPTRASSARLGSAAIASDKHQGRCHRGQGMFEVAYRVVVQQR